MSKTTSTNASQSARKQVVGTDIDPRTGRPRQAGSSKRREPADSQSGGGGADSSLRSIPVVGVAYAGLIDRGPGLAKGSLVVFTVGVALVMTVTVFLVSQALIFGFGEGSSAAAASQLVVPVVAAVPVILGRGWQRLWRPTVLLVLSLLVQPAAVTLVLAAGFARIVWVELTDTSVFAAASQDGRGSADSA